MQESGQKFLDENGKKPGVITTPSGLQYRVVAAGSGPKPKASDTVRVHYRGAFLDGKQFDSSYDRGEPISFAWQGPLLVNGQAQALAGFKQFENPYCIAELPAQQMDIVYGEEGIRLRFDDNQ